MLHAVVTEPHDAGHSQEADGQTQEDPSLHAILLSVVSESSFFILETRMRVSQIQSRSSRRAREFLTLTLRLRDETEKKFPPISGIETRLRFIIFTLGQEREFP